MNTGKIRKDSAWGQVLNGTSHSDFDITYATIYKHLPSKPATVCSELNLVLIGADHFIVAIPHLSIIGRVQDPGPDLSLAQTWFKDCLANHLECCHKDISVHPSRLLHIVPLREHSILRLIESSEYLEVPTYIALSYCWGDSHQLRTTKDNVAQHRIGIEFSALPKTFQDAITVTQYLEFEYLWIDSLCIIQDMPEDWEYECSRMAGIYANAVLTIAAADAANSSVGFLHNYDAPKPLSCQLPYHESGDLAKHENEYIIVEHIPYRPSYSPDKPSRLSQRGWTLQEGLLSNRVLNFRTGRLEWDCRKFTRTDDCHYPYNRMGGIYNDGLYPYQTGWVLLRWR